MNRCARGVLALASLLILVTSFTGGDVAAWTLALSAVWVPVALILLSVGSSRGKRGRRMSVFALAAILTSSVTAVLLLSGDEARWLGLPLATWFMLVGLGGGPLVLVVWRYAATFDLRETDS